MAEFRKSIDQLPLYLKIILALPFVDIVWAIYRICRGDTAGIVHGVLWIIFGSWCLWLVDIIFLAMNQRVWELSAENVESIKNFVKSDEEASEETEKPAEEKSEQPSEENKD